jgi:adenosine deaminase
LEEKIVKKLPKIELHCHLDGSIRPATLRKIADQQGIDLPKEDPQLHQLMIAPEKCKDLNDYLTRFHLVVQCLQTKAALKMAAYDVLSQAAAESIAYIEVRFAPSLHTKKGLSLTEVVTAVLSGLKQGMQDFNIKSNALLCGMRHEEQQSIAQIVHLAKTFKDSGVVGFDLAGNESDYPPVTFEEILNLAKQLTIPITLHAGECGCGHNVAEAVYLGATRIGHGIALKDTPQYLPLLKEKKILLEMCPTSNLQTQTIQSPAEYPLRQFMAAGLKICINTDNRTVSNTTLTQEFLQLAQWCQLTYEEMKQLNQNAVSGAFLSAAEKNTLHALIEQSY